MAQTFTTNFNDSQENEFAKSPETKPAHIDTIKHTKILATIGPSTNSPEMLEAIIRAGVNGCRLNFSHETYEWATNHIRWIRDISRKLDRHIAIIQDLQGPKIRLGKLKDDMKFDIRENDEIGLTFGTTHDGGNNLPVQFDLSEHVKPDENIYLFDGKIHLTVSRIEDKTVWAIAKNSGWVISHKSINLPDTNFDQGKILTKKDLADLKWGANQDFDYVAVSFIHTASDLKYIRDILASIGVDKPVITKVETKAAIAPENLEAIVEASDGIMVARGDLATEAGAEVVPVAQRQMLQLCQKHCKFVIVATQMLGSMVDNPQPTRAEVSDVATAVIDGADAVMLSDETAMGQYPVETVETMRRVIMFTQKNWPVNPLYFREGSDKLRDSIADSAVLLANQISADAIVVETATGGMAKNLAVQRADLPIIAVTPNERVANQLSLTFGTRAFLGVHGTGEIFAQKLLKQNFFGKSTATIVAVFGAANKKSADTIQILNLK